MEPCDEDLWQGITFWVALRLRLDANRDMAKADCIRYRCPGWARFLDRRAAKTIALAVKFNPDAYSGL